MTGAGVGFTLFYRIKSWDRLPRQSFFTTWLKCYKKNNPPRGIGRGFLVVSAEEYNTLNRERRRESHVFVGSSHST